ncbi:ABC transporter ATP-binding protein [Pectobacterium versatile]|uniref:ABC transporter ATP-binding protein n=1 Tax=Pectobacterium versatile TaxID=2488639 RepID=UPI000B7BCBC7|nr:ABC transporter ATP-binding protein [Pectobacterium versatile]ASN85061.1 Multidrug ABC transporter ATPase and permease component [Pectobacterium versatile]MCA6937662.1 ABC transporter ATP-binding protein/permease [Pectobacterium versatile]RJL56830.1 ABC transporter ATP-binding protein [Pectobacterium versatile]RJL60506.1 ABC transporter ATP-binding protein [Pectobacterium versatile]RJL66908.1 ABC transporter ATP-binding protein [Pectobacterium versatile]
MPYAAVEGGSSAATSPSMPQNRAWHIMHPVRGQIRLAMCLSGLSVLAGIAFLLFLAWSIQLLIVQPASWPLLAMSGAVLCLCASYLLRLLAFNQSHYAAFRLENQIRRALAEQLAWIPLGEAQRLGTGSLAKIVQDDVKALHLFVADSTPLYARAVVAPLCTGALLFWLDWRLALAALLVLVIGAVVLMLAMRNAGEMNQRYNQAREEVSTAVIEFVQAMPVVRTFDTGASTFGRYQQALENYLDVLTRWYQQAGFSARFSFAVLNPLPTLLVLCWVTYGFYHSGEFDFSLWVAVLLLGNGMAEAVMPMMALNHMVAKTRLSISRIQDVLALSPLPEAESDALPADASVSFEQVSFRYDRHASDWVLEDVSFQVPTGSVTALVGASGAGKTTVARLIPRFWDVTAGRILIGGVDIRQMKTATLMQQVSFVFQESFLFADTIANNIRLGLPEKSMEEVVAAATAAQAHDFIMALPQGYDTLAGERGQFLSGGQRQRIAIARALLHNRPILVLDEPTAFADPENEAALLAALGVLMQGKTVIMVAHRLSTIRDADQIVVFDRGRLSESGRHDALLAAQGRYSDLWRHYEQAQNWALGSASCSTPSSNGPSGDRA